MSCGDLFLYKGRPNRADRVCVSTCRGPRALTDRLEPPRWGEAWVPLVAAPWGSVQRPRRPPRGGNPTAADEPGRGGGGAGAHGGGGALTRSGRQPQRSPRGGCPRGEAEQRLWVGGGCREGAEGRRAACCALPPPGKGRAWAVESGRRGPFGQGLGSVCRPRPVHQAALPGRVPSFSSQTPAARALGEACPPSATPHHSGRAASAGSRRGREGGLRSAAGGGCPALVSLRPPPRPAPPEQPLRAHVAASVLVGSQEWALPVSAVSPSLAGEGDLQNVGGRFCVYGGSADCSYSAPLSGRVSMTCSGVAASLRNLPGQPSHDTIRPLVCLSLKDGLWCDGFAIT